jgi:predicted TIM-barrel fold metal-dependent hydrolase
MLRIDTHHHFVPPAYMSALRKQGYSYGAGSSIPEWTQQNAIAFMDSSGIETAILSISTPGVHFGDSGEARRLARELNEFGATVVQDRPDRFGLFAVLTLPDVEGAIAEARYALDELHADGVVLLAHVGGQYLGDPAFDPLFDMLNERGAVVFVHPSEIPGNAIDGVPPFAADFLLDTTRAAIKLVTSGTFARCPKLQIILSHAGGFLPYASYRVASLFSRTQSIEQGVATLQRFYFDLALSSTPAALPSLLAFADPTHITFGSDFPYAPIPVANYMADRLTDFHLTARKRYAIERGNAEALFPRLRVPAMS